MRSQSVATRVALTGVIDHGVLDMLCDEIRDGSGRNSLGYLWRTLPGMLKYAESRNGDMSERDTTRKEIAEMSYACNVNHGSATQALIECVIPLMYKGEPTHRMREEASWLALTTERRSGTFHHRGWFFMYEVCVFMSVVMVAVPGIFIDVRCLGAVLSRVLETVTNCLALLSPTDGWRYVVDVNRDNEYVGVTVDQAGAVSRIALYDSRRVSLTDGRGVDRLYVLLARNDVDVMCVCMDEPVCGDMNI